MENGAEKMPRRSFLAHLGGVCLAGNSLLGGGEPPLQALGATCPHQGCQVRPREHFLICPCHRSTFNRAGEPTRGPAQNPLNRYELELVEGGVRLRVS